MTTTVKHVMEKSFDEYQTGDKDPQQDVGEDGQEGSQQLNWAGAWRTPGYQLSRPPSCQGRI